MRTAHFLPFFLSVNLAVAQHAGITVLESSGTPVEFAHVICKDGRSVRVETTDKNGQLFLDLPRPVEISVSFLGMETVTDSLYPGEQKTYRLKPGSQDLREVVVTAQYAPTQEGRSVHKVKVIRKEDIEGRAAFTLDQLLNQQLNIRLNQDNVLGSGMSLNGIGGNNVKVLIDGVPVTGRLNGNLDLSQINLNDIERIEIVEGPLAVNYGSDALAGVIHLITKKGRPKFSASALGYYESFGSTNVDVSLNLPVTNRQIMQLGAGRNFFDGWDPVDTARDQQWNQKEQRFGQAKYQIDSKYGKFELGSRLLWEQIKDKGNRRSAFSNYAFDTWFTTWRVNNHLQWNLEKNGYRYDVLVGRSFFDRSRLKYNRNLVDLTQELTPTASDHDTSRFVQWMSRGSMNTVNRKTLNHQVGYEWNRETGSGDRISGAEQELSEYALWGSANWSPKTWQVQPGLRITYNTRFGWLPVPSVNVRKGLGENAWLRFSYARGYRAPGLKEMFLEFVDANHNIIGNPNLEPEKSHNLTLSFAWNHNRKNRKVSFKAEPAVYYNQVEDMIDLAAIDAVQYSYVNINSLQTYGAKLETSLEVHPHYSFTLGGNLLGQTFDLQGATASYSTPEATALFNYWRASKRFNFMISYKYTGKSPIPLMETEESLSIAEMADYHLLDITVRQKLWKDRLEIGLGAKNLLDVTNTFVTTGGGVHSSGGNLSVARGRSWFASLKINWP